MCKHLSLLGNVHSNCFPHTFCGQNFGSQPSVQKKSVASWWFKAHLKNSQIGNLPQIGVSIWNHHRGWDASHAPPPHQDLPSIGAAIGHAIKTHIFGPSQSTFFLLHLTYPPTRVGSYVSCSHLGVRFSRPYAEWWSSVSWVGWWALLIDDEYILGA